MQRIKRNFHRIALGAMLLVCCSPVLAGKTENVVLIVSDGLRWQEVFSGADELLITDKSGDNWVSEADLRKRYWRADAAARRELLFPFLWGTVAKQGQIFGNRRKGFVLHRAHIADRVLSELEHQRRRERAVGLDEFEQLRKAAIGQR